MQKLHLVGFTTDRKGLILSARRGARSGTFHLAVDQALAESVAELWANQLEAEAEHIEESMARPARSGSALSVREIQARLRQGRSIADIATVAGVDPSWVERFAPPVLAERAQVITTVQSSRLQRARLGPSEHPIGEAIRRNLADRNVSLSPEEFTDAWSARQLADGRWAVEFRYRYRSRDQVAHFDLDPARGTTVAADRPSESLAYVAPTVPCEAPSDGPEPDDALLEAATALAAERARAAAAKKKAAAAKKRAAERAKVKAEKQAADQARRAEEALLAAERRAAARKAAGAGPKEAKSSAPTAKPPADAMRAPARATKTPSGAHPDPGNGSDRPRGRERPPGEPRTRPLRAT